MASVNKIILLGNLGRDPEMRYLPSGEAVAVFSLATSEQWTDKAGNKQERTDWHRIEFIGRIAEVCGEYLKKGSTVYVEGRMQYDKWTDKQGVEKTMAKVRGETMQMVGSRTARGDGSSDAQREERSTSRSPAASPTHEGARSASPASAGSSRPKKLDDFEDDIPF